SGTNGILTPVNPGSYSYDAQPIIIVGPSRWPWQGQSGSQNLTADGQQGSYSVTVANGSSFTPGQFVLLDETSGAYWQPVPPGFNCSGTCPPTVWKGDRVAWNMHNPPQPGDDPQAAMSWFSRTDRPTNEIKEVASVSGNTVTFTSPLSIGYRISHAAQLTTYAAIDAQVPNAGVENLSMYGGADGELRFQHAAYSWAKNIEVTQWLGEGVAVDGS